MREARKARVKVTTRLDSNFVVARFGIDFRKEDVLNNIKPIKRIIYGESHIIYSLKRCVRQGTAGNLFLYAVRDIAISSLCLQLPLMLSQKLL